MGIYDVNVQVAATPDLMLAHLDFFLGGDEKRNDLPPPVHERLPMPLIFGGDGSYMAYYSLQSDDILTSLLSQVGLLFHLGICVALSFLV